jgi:hypothetical protein
MTTTALKEIDRYGGLDTYMLELDEKSVSESNHNSRVRDLIASTLFYQEKLDGKYCKRFGYVNQPPMKPEEIRSALFQPLVPNKKRPNREPLTPVFRAPKAIAVNN